MNKKDTERLLELVEKRARQYGEFTLASGLKVNHYFDLKQVLGDPEGITLTGKIMFRLAVREKIKAVGGEGMGGRLITAAVILTSQLAGRPIPGFEVLKRKELREDDPQKYESEDEYVIKGHFPPAGSGVALFDDVMSTGGSILRAIKVVEDKGCKVVKIIVLLDRLLGGSKELRKRGYDFTALLRADTSGNVYIN